MAGSNSMPTETKNSTAKASRNGSDLGGGLLAELRFAQHHAGEEGAERERDAEQLGRRVGDAERDRQNGEAEQLAAAGMGDVMQDRRDELLADDQHDGDEKAELGEQERDREHDLGELGRCLHLAKQGGQTGQQHEHQHHGDVLHDQPADGDPPALGLEQPPLLQHAQQHHGARHRQRDSEDDTRAERPAEPPADRHAERRGDESLRQRPGNRDGADRQQILGRKVQPHAEHQENDADLGQLIGDVLVGDGARGERSDDDARHQIADQRRQLETVRQNAEAEGEHEAECDGGNQGRHVRHEKTFNRAGVPEDKRDRAPFAFASNPSLTMNGTADNPSLRRLR